MKRSSKPTFDPAAPLKLACYAMSDILESGLLTPTRIAEIEAAMAADTSPVFDKNGALAVNAKIITQGGKRVLILDGSDQDYARDYHRRNHFAEFLTQEEIARLNAHTFSARAKRRDAERFEKAEKIDAKEWNGWVTDGDSYYESVYDWLDRWADGRCEGNGGDDGSDGFPTHIWAAEPEVVVPDLSVSEVLESHIDARGWEDCSSEDFSGVDALQTALDVFVEANQGVVSYHENPKKAILVEALCRTHLNELAAAAEVIP